MRPPVHIIVASLILLALSDGALACRLIRRKCRTSAPTTVASSQAETPADDLAKLLAKVTPQQLENLVLVRGSWPDYVPWESLSAKTNLVVAASATGPAKLGKSSSDYIRTEMKVGNRVIQGGGFTRTTECRQEFLITEVLHGQANLEKRAVDYWIMDSRAFPGPPSTRPIPAGAKAILLFGEGGELLAIEGNPGELLKAIEDNPENRQAVREALSRKKATLK